MRTRIIYWLIAPHSSSLFRLPRCCFGFRVVFALLASKTAEACSEILFPSFSGRKTFFLLNSSSPSARSPRGQNSRRRCFFQSTAFKAFSWFRRRAVFSLSTRTLTKLISMRNAIWTAGEEEIADSRGVRWCCKQKKPRERRRVYVNFLR